MITKDFPTFIIPEVFTKEEYDSIYDIALPLLENANSTTMNQDIRAVEDTGYFAVTKMLPNNIYEKIKDITERYTGLELELPQIHFARYSTKTGANPILRPHRDQMLTHPTITLSVQMNKSLEWALYCFTEKFSTEPNNGVGMSGSHQVHWRPDMVFGEDDYYDIMVCQMTLKGSNPISDEERAELSEMQNMFIQTKYEAIRAQN